MLSSASHRRLAGEGCCSRAHRTAGLMLRCQDSLPVRAQSQSPHRSSGERAEPDALLPPRNNKPIALFATRLQNAASSAAWAVAELHRSWRSRRPSEGVSDPTITGPVAGGGLPLLAMAAVIVPPALSDLVANRVFMAGFVAWFLAQFGKIFTERYKKGYWDIRAFVAPGGTPSSHSSLCSGITAAIAMVEGLGSPVFAAALAFTAIVMYDAMGVRRHAGMHAQVLNRVVNEMRESLESSADESVDDMGPLKEVLGHTPRQVFSGALLGVIVGVLYPMYF